MRTHKYEIYTTYGLNMSTALWITCESERLREITLKEKIQVDETCEQGKCNHLWEGQPRKKTRSNSV